MLTSCISFFLSLVDRIEQFLGVLLSERCRAVGHFRFCKFLLRNSSDIAIYFVSSDCVRVWAVSSGMEVAADGVHWGPSGFYLAAGVHFSALSPK